MNEHRFAELLQRAYGAVRTASGRELLDALHPDVRGDYLRWLRTSQAASAEVQYRARHSSESARNGVSVSDDDLVSFVLGLFPIKDRAERPTHLKVVEIDSGLVRLEYFLDYDERSFPAADGLLEQGRSVADDHSTFADDDIDPRSLGIPPHDLRARAHGDRWFLVPLQIGLIPLPGYAGVISYWEIVEPDPPH